ncbi:MAG: AAA family ATPase [Chloroflexota bacterium]
MNPQAIKSMRLKNFKAIRDTGEIEFAPFTVLIGNNGSGKSSLIEGLETFQTIVERGLDEAMNRWRGIENIRNRAAVLSTSEAEEEATDVEEPPDETDYVAQYGHADEEAEAPQDVGFAPISFLFSQETTDGIVSFEVDINSSPNADALFIEIEKVRLNATILQQRIKSGLLLVPAREDKLRDFQNGESLFSEIDSVPLEGKLFAQAIKRWQFALLNPDAMVNPVPRTRTGKEIRLTRNGSNIAEYLLDIRLYDAANGTTIFDDIVDTLRYVLPYAEDLQPNVTSELERSAYLQLTEGEFKVPGWLLSSGTLRIVALLALLRHPQPPPLIVIEEIENGLDPRTINLIMQEIMEITESGKSQVIVTTHSPYLLDLIPLENIIVVERIDGQPIFFRPSDDESMRKWSESFTPGTLYTMSQLTRRSE